MCKDSIFYRLVKKGIMAVETLLTSTKLTTPQGLAAKALLDRQTILEIMGALLKDLIIQLSDLDTYVLSGWITEEEKTIIIQESENPSC